MPGKVVRVLVGEGDAVERGQGLVVIEAMKMQNELKSPKAGRVSPSPRPKALLSLLPKSWRWWSKDMAEEACPNAADRLDR